MVVLLPVEGYPASRPPLFGILHHDGAPIATFRIEDYHLWSLGATCVHGVTSRAHKHLEGKWFSSLAAASQHVYGKICGQSRTVYMRTVRLYLRGDIPDIIVNSPFDIKIRAHEPLAHAHVAARVESCPSDVGGGRWLPIGKGRPFIPHTMQRSAALNPSLWASYDPPQKQPGDGPSAEGRGAESSRVRDDEEEPPSKRQRKSKKGRRKPDTEVGAVVWDGRAMDLPPVALVVREVLEDPGDATRPCATFLVLESLESEPRRLRRRTSEVSNFDVQLRMIYQDRRMLLEAEGLWAQTVAQVKRALLQRQVRLRVPVTMSDMWTGRTLLAMGNEPCPVTDEAAAEWLAARRVEAERTEEAEA